MPISHPWVRVARYSASQFGSRRKSPPHLQAHPKQPVAVLGLHLPTQAPYSAQSNTPHLTTLTYSCQSPASSPVVVRWDPPLVAGRVDIPACIGLVHGCMGFVGGDNRIVELDMEGSSAARSYSQRNHMENCAMLDPPSVLSNVGMADPRDIYPGTVSIFVYSYYCL